MTIAHLAKIAAGARVERLAVFLPFQIELRCEAGPGTTLQAHCLAELGDHPWLPLAGH